MCQTVFVLLMHMHAVTLAKDADPSTPNPAWYKLTKVTGLGLWGSTSKCMVRTRC
jgi:hypothetical protein